MPSRNRIPALLALAAVLLFSAPVSATADDAEPEEGTESPIESLKKDLLGVQKNLTSVSFRIRHPISGTTDSSGGSKPPTPGLACCSSNLERIEMKFRRMRKTLERLDLYYAARNDSEALAALDRVRIEMNVVSRGMAVFAMAETRARATDAQQSVVRPFNRLRDAITALGHCCPIEGPLPDASGGS
jgi:hypothetical protein